MWARFSSALSDSTSSCFPCFWGERPDGKDYRMTGSGPACPASSSLHYPASSQTCGDPLRPLLPACWDYRPAPSTCLTDPLYKLQKSSEEIR
ncbi:mCG147984 [Mus musculus]|nr:mCG147984 [Mus musculus]